LSILVWINSPGYLPHAIDPTMSMPRPSRGQPDILCFSHVSHSSTLWHHPCFVPCSIISPILSSSIYAYSDLPRLPDEIFPHLQIWIYFNPYSRSDNPMASNRRTCACATIVTPSESITHESQSTSGLHLSIVCRTTTETMDNPVSPSNRPGHWRFSMPLAVSETLHTSRAYSDSAGLMLQESIPVTLR
jgi:hypothetical protein